MKEKIELFDSQENDQDEDVCGTTWLLATLNICDRRKIQ